MYTSTTEEVARQSGIGYEPSYVLSREEVNSLMADACHKIREPPSQAEVSQ